jgi:O-antigen ligase
MSALTAIGERSPTPPAHWAPWVALPLLATALAAWGAWAPKAVVVTLGAVALGLLFIRSIDWATYVALFVMYSNLAVVAVKYHGVPGVAANAVAGLLLLPALKNAVQSQGRIALGPAFPWLVGLAVVQCLGVVNAESPERAWDDLLTFLIEGLALYLLVRNAVQSQPALHGATWTVLLAGCLMGGVPLYQQLTGSFANEYGGLAQTGGEPGFETGQVTAAGEVSQYRLAGPIGEKNRYAQIMLMLVPLAILRLRAERDLQRRVLAAACAALAAAGVFLAFSRSTIIAVGLVVLVAAWLRLVDRRKVGLLFVVACFGLLVTPQYRTRLASLLDLRELALSGRHASADGALKGRATEMGAAAMVFLDHPLVGVGPGQFKYYSREYGERIGLRALGPERQAHCLPLDVAAENGLLGLLCLGGVAWCTSSALLAGRRRAERVDSHAAQFATAYFLVLMVYFATGLFLHFAFIRYFWLMVALADSAAVLALSSSGACRGREASHAC